MEECPMCLRDVKESRKLLLLLLLCLAFVLCLDVLFRLSSLLLFTAFMYQYSFGLPACSFLAASFLHQLCSMCGPGLLRRRVAHVRQAGRCKQR